MFPPEIYPSHTIQGPPPARRNRPRMQNMQICMYVGKEKHMHMLENIALPKIDKQKLPFSELMRKKQRRQSCEFVLI